MLGNLFSKEKSNIEVQHDGLTLDMTRVPHHVAIIMDGNGRWAKRRGMPRSAGHKAGADTLKQIIMASDELGIKVLTVYAFSTENWKRPEEEVSYIMNLMLTYLKKNLADLDAKNVQLRFIGDRTRLSKDLQELFNTAETSMYKNSGLIVNVAVNYGGRGEIATAVKSIVKDVENKKIEASQISEELISTYLYTAPENEVDLLIRPGADLRISNYLLWQIAYAEFWYTDLCWPDFTKETLIEAIKSYQGRDRRFGGLHEE